MLFEREISNVNLNSNSNLSPDADKNSAASSSLTCPTEKKLRNACYCEENVWRLAYRRLFGSTGDIGGEASKENEQYYVVFVSNEEKCCPMLYQVASEHPLKPCFWDYHVILILSKKVMKMGKQVMDATVYDMDSNLKYPCSLDSYLNNTFDFKFRDHDEAIKFAPLFRIVRAEKYIEHFHSDRMHMMKDGKWMATPPKYDCIKTPNMKKNKSGFFSNLFDYVSMKRNQKSSSILGEVLTLEQLKKRFGIQ